MLKFEKVRDRLQISPLIWSKFKHITQPTITWSKLTTETLEQGVEYVQS